jgi:hypothetical protein
MNSCGFRAICEAPGVISCHPSRSCWLTGIQRGEAAITPAFTRLVLEEFSRTTLRLSFHETNTTDRAPAPGPEEFKTGASNHETATLLVLSEQTVKNHISRIYLSQFEEPL